MCKSLRFYITSLALVAMCALSAMAQSTTTGAINGTVTNPNKEVVAGATVTVKNNGTNKEATATTDDNGGFKISNLEPGIYTVNANGTGTINWVSFGTPRRRTFVIGDGGNQVKWVEDDVPSTGGVVGGSMVKQ